jgi:hypothetical protein
MLLKAGHISIPPASKAAMPQEPITRSVLKPPAKKSADEISEQQVKQYPKVSFLTTIAVSA